MPEFGSPSQILGSFTGVDFIEVDTVDFERAAIAIAELANYVDNVELPLRAVVKIARDDIKERFEKENDPEGDGWFELSPGYAERKQKEVGFEHPILQREGELYKKATDGSNWSVSGESVWYSTANLPDYWAVHQFGSADFGAQFHATANPKGETSLEGGAQNIPPRAFIGLSKKAEAKVLDLFDIWFSNGLERATKDFLISSHGALHVRTPLGRIGERIPL